MFASTLMLEVSKYRPDSIRLFQERAIAQSSQVLERHRSLEVLVAVYRRPAGVYLDSIQVERESYPSFLALSAVVPV
jgi:hypothetical protein